MTNGSDVLRLVKEKTPAFRTAASDKRVPAGAVAAPLLPDKKEFTANVITLFSGYSDRNYPWIPYLSGAKNHRSGRTREPVFGRVQFSGIF
jgi:hypothetical protein